MQEHWSQAHCGCAAFCGDGCIFCDRAGSMDSSLLLEKIQTWRVHWPGCGEWPWECPPRVHPSPASCQWGPSQYKLSYSLSLEWEIWFSETLNETDPLTTWCGKDRGQVPTWDWQKESYGLQVSLRTFPPNWVDDKPWGWHHLPLFCTHHCAFRGMSMPWKYVGSHSMTHHFPGEKVQQVSRTSFLDRVTLPGRINQWWSLPTKAALESYSFSDPSYFSPHWAPSQNSHYWRKCHLRQGAQGVLEV